MAARSVLNGRSIYYDWNIGTWRDCKTKQKIKVRGAK